MASTKRALLPLPTLKIWQTYKRPAARLAPTRQDAAISLVAYRLVVTCFAGSEGI